MSTRHSKSKSSEQNATRGTPPEGADPSEMFTQLLLKMEEQRQQEQQHCEEQRHEEQQRQEEKRRLDEEQRHKDDLAREERMTQMMLQFTQAITIQTNKRETDREEALFRERERNQTALEEKIKLERERLIFDRETRRQAQEEQRKRDKLQATAPMTKMSEKEDVETYLDLFEKHEQFLEIPKEIWTAHLRPLLNSRARDVLVGAQALDEADFDALRAHLVKALGCRTESLGSQCTKLRGNDMETFAELEHRTRKLYSRWLKDMDAQQRLQAVVLEKLYSMLPLQCMHHCRDKKPKTSLELAGAVSDYLTDHNLTNWKSYQGRQDREWKPQQQGGQTNSRNKTPSQQLRPIKPRDDSWEKSAECFYCKERGHIAVHCPKKPMQFPPRIDSWFRVQLMGDRRIS